MPFLGGRGQSSRGYFGGGTTPDAPTSLSSTPGNGQLSIAFTPPSFDGGLLITNYEWSVNAGATWTPVSPEDITSPVVIGPLNNGTSYTVYLRAVNALGPGKTSAPVSVNTTPYTVPSAPTIGTITTSINSPNQVSTPSMSEDCSNASFSWTNPGAGGVTLTVPFTPGFNGGSTVTNYFYSTDNGATFKSAGTTTSPLTITTVSGSSAALQPSTTYNIKLYAVNIAGNGTQSTASSRTTLDAVTSYKVTVYDSYSSSNAYYNEYTNTTGSYSISHYQAERKWSVRVRAVNDGGTGPYSSYSSVATGWEYDGYNADYATTKECTRNGDCDSCGTKTGTEDGTVARTCYRWTRSGCTTTDGLACVTGSTSWQGNCRDLGNCSDTWITVTGTGTFGGEHYTGFNEFMGSYYMYKTSCPSGNVCGLPSCTSCNCSSLYYAYVAQYCTTTKLTRVIAVGCKDGRTK